jgi:hypothetical protein
MEKIKTFFSKHGLIAFMVLLLVMLLQTCNKNGSIKKLTKERNKLEVKADSLSKLVLTDKNILLIEYKSEYDVYDKINNEMSKLNRQAQMMEFQNQHIIPKKVDLENKIKALETK